MMAEFLTAFIRNGYIPKIVEEKYGKELKENKFIMCILFAYINPRTLKVEKYGLYCAPTIPEALSLPPNMAEKIIGNPHDVSIVLVMLVISAIVIVVVVIVVFYRKSRKRTLQ